MQFDTRRKSQIGDFELKSKKELFLKALEKELQRLLAQGRISSEDVQERSNRAREIPESHLSGDPVFDADIFASANFVETKKNPSERVVIRMRTYEMQAQALEDKHRERFSHDLDEYQQPESRRNIIAAVHQFPRAVLEHYVGHGVKSDLAAVLSILDTNIFIGEVGHLVSGMEYCSAYLTGNFLIVSARDTSLKEEGTQPIHVDIDREYGSAKGGTRIAQNAVFVCNVSFDSFVDDLRKMFPDKKILRASELVDYIKDQEEAVK